ncbi:MAG: HU family DNA-binding protein [Bacteroidota bacterium]
MNKGELINKLAEDANLTKVQATEAVNCVINCIGNTLKDGEKVSLVGFGTFTMSTRDERMGRNPRTGESITIPKRNVVKFKPGKDLNASLN